MSNSPDERGAELRELFFESAQELLQSLNEEALKLEKTPGDAEIVRSIRRTVHTLKGDAAACGFRELSELAHEFEDALALEGAASACGRWRKLLCTRPTFSRDAGRVPQGRKLPSREPLEQDDSELRRSCARASEKGRQERSRQSRGQGRQWTEYEKLAMQKAQSRGQDGFSRGGAIDPHCAMPIAGAAAGPQCAGTSGTQYSARVRSEVAGAANSRRIRAGARRQTAEQIAAQVPDSDDRSEESDWSKYRWCKHRCGSASRHGTQSDPRRDDLPTRRKPTKSRRRRDTARLRERRCIARKTLCAWTPSASTTCLNLVGELIIGKSMLQQALQEFSQRYPKDPLRGKFADAMAFQARVLNDLQRSVMKIRMVPVEQLFRRFPRMVRDVAQHAARMSNWWLSGQDTDLDKSILDAIAEPLTHLVRNAVSHGIETAEERAQAGSRPQGTIRLNAYHQGNQVIVEVSDDGRGMDVRKIRAKAIEHGSDSARKRPRA